jgi:hypothetical protein
MRFAARESALFGQPEVGFGLVPGAGAMQHLARFMGRGRALEVVLSGGDYDAGLAERYGWINRALDADKLGDFVGSLAQRIAGFPPAALATIKDRVGAIMLASADEFRRDSDLFVERAGEPAAQTRTQAAMTRGFQTRTASWPSPACSSSSPTAEHRKRSQTTLAVYTRAQDSPANSRWGQRRVAHAAACRNTTTARGARVLMLRSAASAGTGRGASSTF